MMGGIKLFIISLTLFVVTAYDVQPENDRGQRNYRERSHSHVEFNVRGLVPTVFTPLHHDGSVALEAIPPYADYLIHKGIKAVLVGGTTGEHMSLNVEQRKSVIAEWVKIGKETGLHIMAQVGAAPYAEVHELTKFSVKIGVDSIMTLPELFFKPRTVDELVFFVGLVANDAPHLPVLYYHFPNNTGVTVNMPAFVAAASERIPNFKGIKFSDPNLAEADQTHRTLRHDQELFIAPELEIAPAALLGIRSVITPILNLFPLLSQAIEDAVAKSDLEKASYLQHKLTLAAEAILAEGQVPAMKAAMEIVTGLKMGPPALPQRPISHAARQRIQNRLKEIGLI